MRHRFARFKLRAHFLECGGESFDLLLLARISRDKPSDGRLLFLVLPVTRMRAIIFILFVVAQLVVKIEMRHVK